MTFETKYISEIVDEISMGPFGSNIKVECFVDEGIPVLNGSNLEGFELNEDTFRYVTLEKANSLGKANAHRGDIVITHRGTLGQIVFIPKTSKYDRYVISQSQFRIKCNDLAIPEYVVYYFHTRIGQHKLLSNASQVGVPALARPTTTFQKIDIELPDIISQQKIVAILQEIQEKITINTKINENLEQQAQAICEQWVFEHSNDIVMKQLADIADINPDTYSPKEKWECVNYLDTSSITNGVISGIQMIRPDTDKLPSRARRIIKANDIVYSTVRPNQLHFGIINNPLDNMLASTGFAVIRSRHSYISSPYIYHFLTSSDFIETMQQLAEQSTSTFPSVKPSDIGTCIIPCTEIEKMQNITDKLNNMYAMVSANHQENQHLSTLRDTLLPKLMNGEIDVSSVKI